MFGYDWRGNVVEYGAELGQPDLADLHEQEVNELVDALGAKTTNDELWSIIRRLEVAAMEADGSHEEPGYKKVVHEFREPVLGTVTQRLKWLWVEAKRAGLTPIKTVVRKRGHEGYWLQVICAEEIDGFEPMQNYVWCKCSVEFATDVEAELPEYGIASWTYHQ